MGSTGLPEVEKDVWKVLGCFGVFTATESHGSRDHHEVGCFLVGSIGTDTPATTHSQPYTFVDVVQPLARGYGELRNITDGFLSYKEHFFQRRERSERERESVIFLPARMNPKALAFQKGGATIFGSKLLIFHLWASTLAPTDLLSFWKSSVSCHLIQ